MISDVAYHEAGHAVVAAAMGVTVLRIELTPPPEPCACYYEPTGNTERATIAVAGEVAAKMFGRRSSMSRSDIQSFERSVGRMNTENKTRYCRRAETILTRFTPALMKLAELADLDRVVTDKLDDILIDVMPRNESQPTPPEPTARKTVPMQRVMYHDAERRGADFHAAGILDGALSLIEARRQKVRDAQARLTRATPNEARELRSFIATEGAAIDQQDQLLRRRIIPRFNRHSTIQVRTEQRGDEQEGNSVGDHHSSNGAANLLRDQPNGTEYVDRAGRRCQRLRNAGDDQYVVKVLATGEESIRDGGGLCSVLSRPGSLQDCPI